MAIALEEGEFRLELNRPIGTVAGILAHFGEIKEINFESATERSLLFEVISGRRPALGGRKLLRGRDISGMTTSELVRAGFAFGSARFPVVPALSVADHLQLAGGLSRLKRNRFRVEDTEKLLSACGVSLRDRCGDLSGGQQQAAMLALALTGPAVVVVIEEPWTGLAGMACDLFSEYMYETSGWRTFICLQQQGGG